MSETPRTDEVARMPTDAYPTWVVPVAFARALEIENQALQRENAKLLADLQAACDHEWEPVDDSFSHEFGTEIIRYMLCEKCGLTKHWEDSSDDVDERDWDRERDLREDNP